MTHIGNWTSLLEICFAINALYFFTQYRHTLNEKLKGYVTDYFSSLDKHKEKTGRSFSGFPYLFLYQNTVYLVFLFAGFLAIIFTGYSTYLLIRASVNPDAQYETWWMIFCCLTMVFLVPLLTMTISELTYWIFNKAFEYIEESIQEKVSNNSKN